MYTYIATVLVSLFKYIQMKYFNKMHLSTGKNQASLTGSPV